MPRVLCFCSCLAQGLTFAILLGCGKRDESKVVPRSPRETERGVFEVSGEVFIVLKSRETLKLSGVQVHLMPESSAELIFAKKREGLTNALPLVVQHSQLSNDLGRLNAEYQDAQLALTKAQNKEAAVTLSLMEAKAKLVASERRKPNEFFINIGAYEKAYNEYLDYCSSKLDAVSAWTDAHNKLEKVEAERLPVVQSLEKVGSEIAQMRSASYVFEGQAYPSDKATVTDSEGRFTLPIPLAGKYFVFARADRQIEQVKEEYVWCVPAHDLKAKIILSNHDLLFEHRE